MNEQEILNYGRIAKTIEYIKANFRSQPDLDELAAAAGLSPFHFQRLFSDWAGVSPKKFLQYLSVDYAKGLLRNNSSNLFDVAHATGLSGTGRLHDLFVNIEGMTPGEYKNGGQSLRINYNFADSPFGTVLLASTPKGLCHMAFVDDEAAGLADLKKQFPKATYVQDNGRFQQNALQVFTQQQRGTIQVHLKGTDFQLKVWEALLKIPTGCATTYGQIASVIGKPNASRAVGSAIGDNPIAFIIPCHRVIQAGGTYGQYRWGSTRKSMLLGWEAAQLETAATNG